MKDTYRALTRTYRPQTFEEIVAQDHVSNTLRNAIRNERLSHAYMFCGPRGVGKTTMARVLAREVNQVDSTIDGEALGGTLNIVEMDAASNRKIEDVRALKEVIRVPPQNGRFKIFIIDEVHMLTKEAFNALLKTLEEPPEHAIFIFATTEPHKVLPTILSRVQRFDFKRISVKEIVQRLRAIAERESIQIDEESLHVIAKRADGALRDALGLMDQAIAFCGTKIKHQELLTALNMVGVDDLFDLTEAVAAQDANRSLAHVQKLVLAGTDIQEFLVSLTEHLRNLYIACQSERMSLIEATEETRKRYREHTSAFSEEDLIRMLHLVSETQQSLRDARQPKVQFEILILKLVHMNRSRDLETLIGELRSLKKKLTNGTPASVKASVKRTSKGPFSKAEQTVGQPLVSDEDPPEKEKRETNESEESAPSNVSSPPPAEEDELYGRPSLGTMPESRANGHVRPVEDSDEITTGLSVARESVPGDQAENETEATPSDGVSVHVKDGVRPTKMPELEDVGRCWDQLLEELKLNAPRMLYFQMQRVRVTTLKGRELIVSADNEFARQLLEENQKALFTCFKKVLGQGLKIRCKVERQEKSRDETLSPYERFKELQKKDPRIRTLVELFGAELEY